MSKINLSHRKTDIPFCPALFLLSAEQEFRTLLKKLGLNDWEADLRAFQMTASLAQRIADLNLLWNHH